MIADLDLLGMSVRVDVEPAAVSGRLFGLLEPFTRSGRTPSRALSLKEASSSSVPDGALTLLMDDHVIREAMQPSQALGMFLWQMNQVALDTITHVVLHAGCVALDGEGLVLSAPMEAGKSTLVTHLVGSGFDYLSDEFAAVTLDGQAVEAYPCPITLDPGSFELFPELRPLLPAELDDPARWHVSATEVRPRSHCDSAAISCIVLPRYRQGDNCRIERIEPKEALRRLVGEALNLRNLGGTAFSVLSRLVQRAPVFSLEYGDLDRAERSVRELMERSAS